MWLNRNTQKKVLANSKRASNGALIINQVIIPSGYSVVLGTKASGLDRADYQLLQQHNANVLTEFTLKLDGEVMQVIWDNTGNAVSGEDLFDQVGGYDLVTNVVLRFLTV
ncbi:hypothetical protein CXF83_14945 [Shewanella sp. Choline-02u-19]|nr:hypothetical protein CXF84_00985 [Shewanella sp. Bg11-22]PKI29360.1 hypothetical protein CXF83_14945 [Shewanella sp. Choline-02u-19]